MATRTVYVSDADVPLYERANELAGGLSAAVTAALRRYVEVEEARMETFEEITVRVGSGWAPQEKRFFGRRLVRVRVPGGDGRVATYDVYRTRGGRLAVHHGDSPDWGSWGSSGEEAWSDPATWSADYYRPGPQTLDVYGTADELAEHLPDEVSQAVADTLHVQPVETLDI